MFQLSEKKQKVTNFMDQIAPEMKCFRPYGTKKEINLL
ncbi:hypothetical protein ES702_03219 [subsurface metagenome]